MGAKMGWIQIKMGHPLAQNGAALAPFRANGTHPSVRHRSKYIYIYIFINMISYWARCACQICGVSCMRTQM